MGSLDGVTPEEKQERLAQAQFIGALAGFLFSQGDGENVSLAGTIARSGFENNYLNHNDLVSLRSELEACKAKSDGVIVPKKSGIENWNFLRLN